MNPSATTWRKAAWGLYNYYRACEEIGHPSTYKERQRMRWLLLAFEAEQVQADLAAADDATKDDYGDLLAELISYVAPDLDDAFPEKSRGLLKQEKARAEQLAERRARKAEREARRQAKEAARDVKRKKHAERLLAACPAA